MVAVSGRWVYMLMSFKIFFLSCTVLFFSPYWKWHIHVWMVSRWMVLLQQTELWHQVRHHEEADELYQVASDTHRWAQLLLFCPLTLMTVGSAFSFLLSVHCFRSSAYVNAGNVFVHIIHNIQQYDCKARWGNPAILLINVSSVVLPNA